ncbi:MAG: hypothetical protein IVW54_02540 [Candidatus Binataceae bacterium]|nr:hypothetical protein [Candidatus Binataceae bacterium]
MKSARLMFATVMILAAPALARAQYLGRGTGYTVITPGGPPTFVNPNYNGGYTAITPGAPPTFINRNFNGGYTVITPGEPPSFINPTTPSALRAPAFGGDNGGDE